MEGGGRTQVLGVNVCPTAYDCNTLAGLLPEGFPEGIGGGEAWHKAMVLVCLPLAAPIGLHCTSPPSVGPNVFWSCQQSPWMICHV